MTATRKILSAATALLLSGGATLYAASAQEITLWTLNFSAQAANDAMKKVAADFEAANPGSKVTIVTRGTDEHKTALRVAAGSDKGPDIYFSWAGLGLGGEYVKAGLSQPLDKYYTEYKWNDELVPAAASFADIYPGGKHGVPYTFKGEVLYYNKNLFEQAGITEEPKTYDELVAAAEKLKAAGIPAITFGGTVNWHLMRLMDVLLETKCGAEKHDALKAMTAKWSEEACATEAFAEMDKWAKNYILSPFMGIDQAQSFSLFTAGRAAMMLEGKLAGAATRRGHQCRRLRADPVPDRHEPALRLCRILLSEPEVPESGSRCEVPRLFAVDSGAAGTARQDRHQLDQQERQVREPAPARSRVAGDIQRLSVGLHERRPGLPALR